MRELVGVGLGGTAQPAACPARSPCAHVVAQLVQDGQLEEVHAHDRLARGCAHVRRGEAHRRCGRGRLTVHQCHHRLHGVDHQRELAAPGFGGSPGCGVELVAADRASVAEAVT